MSQNQLTQTCLDLIDIESVSRNETAVENYIRNALPESFSITYEKDSVLFATMPRTAGREYVVLVGHTDTVPIENNFPSRVDGDIIHGRGTADMKSGLAVMLELARWIDEQKVDLKFDIGLLFFGREELAAAECPLLDALSDEAFNDISLGIIMEPTNNTIEAGCLGNLNLTLHFQGESAHSARPWYGDNAVNKAILALQDFVQREPIDVTLDGLTFREVASITGIRGGIARNVIPSDVEIDINIRYAPSRTPEQVETESSKFFKGLGARVEVISNARPAPVVVNYNVVKELMDAGVTTVAPKQAWTNAADFAEHNIAAINFGPGDPYYAHRQDERVKITALDECLHILKKFVAKDIVL